MEYCLMESLEKFLNKFSDLSLKTKLKGFVGEYLKKSIEESLKDCVEKFYIQFLHEY